MAEIQEIAAMIPRIAETLVTAGTIIQIITGVLTCFFGYKFLKGWVSLCGFALGAVLGFFAGRQVTDQKAVLWLIVLAAGILMALIAYKICVAGVFILGCIMTVSGLYLLGGTFEISTRYVGLYLIISIILGIIAGALLVKFMRPGIILFTGIKGAISVTSGLHVLMGWNEHMVLTAGILFAAAGIILQFLTTKE